VASTQTDPNATAWLDISDDAPVQLREWGTGRTHPFPPATQGHWVIGAASDCWLRVQDPYQYVSRKHALLKYDVYGWAIADARSKNGLWIDGERSALAHITPGIEIGVGCVRFIVESPRTVRLRSLLSRFIGWGENRQPYVDCALRALREFALGRSPLWLDGSDDLIAIARRLHREMLGDERPFVIADVDSREVSIEEAIRRAEDGTLCLPLFRMQAHFEAVRELARSVGMRCRVVVCVGSSDHAGWRAIEIPALSSRKTDIGRIIDEYASDAITRLCAQPTSYAGADRAWLLEHPPNSLGEIETTTLRFVAIREHGGVTRAAPHLGLTHSALSRWLARRVAAGRRRKSRPPR